ncbi:hypothetical protein AVEN_119811-1 [Araneus ventricosus]|uniref:Uncharacterized protein n=1 Tax=Araneus ventricosus TaxID=182803 RepID=A0A4Y2RA77_ARAVE|nr:hypothetical protein AVEN_119811-1 [Araneus ventricosus]
MSISLRKEKQEKEDKLKLWQLTKAEVNKTKRNKPAKNSTKKKKVAKRLLDFNVLNLKTQLIHLNFLMLTLMTIWTQRISIMKNASFAVSKENRNWDSNVLFASSGPVPPVLAGTKSKPMAMRFLQLISFLKV